MGNAILKASKDSLLLYCGDSVLDEMSIQTPQGSMSFRFSESDLGNFFIRPKVKEDVYRDVIAYRGLDKDLDVGAHHFSLYGWGIYSATLKREALKYGSEIHIMGKQGKPVKPLRFKDRMAYENFCQRLYDWVSLIDIELGRELQSYGTFPTVVLYLMGYDGLSIGDKRDAILLRFLDISHFRLGSGYYFDLTEPLDKVGMINE